MARAPSHERDLALERAVSTYKEPSWRDVSPRSYRRINLLSTVAGTLLLAYGLWELSHGRILKGVPLIVLGMVLGLWTAALRIEGAPAPLYTLEKSQGVAPRGENWVPQVVHFYTRMRCSICYEARIRLAKDLEDAPVTIVDHDVDKDETLKARYGERVPVAVYRGEELFALAYDQPAVRAVARQARQA